MAGDNTKTENVVCILFMMLGAVPFFLLFPIWFPLVLFAYPLYILSMFLYVTLFGDKPAPPKHPPK